MKTWKFLGFASLVVGAFVLAACNDSSEEEVQNIRIIAMNDFHGNIEVPTATNGGSVIVKESAAPINTGGAAFIASLVNQLKSSNKNSIVVAAGDNVNASPVTSTLFHQEPAIDVLNQIGLEVSSVGNHEFDLGKSELLRLQNGGCFVGGVVGTDTCLNGGTFSGAKFKYLAANVVGSDGKTLLPATYTKTFGGITVGFIGLTFKDTPSAVLPSGVAGLTFLDEVATINTYAAKLRSDGASAVVVLIHQGGQTTASSLNDKSCPGLTGAIVPIVNALSKDVDVVVSGHTHQEYVCSVNGKLLTSTGFYGSTLTSIDLTVAKSGVKSVSADNIPVINDTNKTLPTGRVALVKDPAVDATVQSYVAKAAAVKNLPVGSITATVSRALLPNTSTPTRDETAEGAMGDIMADFYFAGVPKADFAITNPGGVRADLVFQNGGVVTYGDLLTVAPFSNDLVTVDLTGAQIIRLLEQQWEKANCDAKTGVNGCGRLLQPSSQLKYSWDASKPAGASDGAGARLVPGSVTIGGVALDATKTYRIATNSFLGQGGDNFTVMKAGVNYTATGYKDIDAFVAYMKSNPKVSPPVSRVTRIN